MIGILDLHFPTSIRHGGDIELFVAAVVGPHQHVIPTYVYTHTVASHTLTLTPSCLDLFIYYKAVIATSVRHGGDVELFVAAVVGPHQHVIHVFVLQVVLLIQTDTSLERVRRESRQVGHIREILL
jgi:hypothetical protein